MASSSNVRVTVTDGRLVFIYTDELQPLFDQAGDVCIARASHVEPDRDGRWWADMQPSDGPALGPYPTRQAALEAEVAWLAEYRGL